MKKIVIISIILFGAFAAKSQQQFVYTNFLMNDFYYSPAIAGMKDVHLANVGFRAQWAGFSEAPMSMYANFYGSVKNEQKHGYGIAINNDRSGLVSNTGFLANYVYHLKLGERQKLAFGVKPGFQQYNIKLYDAQLADEGDPQLTGNVLSTGAFDLQAGMNWYGERFFVMASMRHIFGPIISATGFNDGLAKHYTFVGGYNWLVNKKKKKKKEGDEADGEGTDANITNEATSDSTLVPKKKRKDFELMPVIMVNYVDPITPQGSIMLKATFDHKYWAGISYRTQDAAGFSLGLVIKDRLNIGYSYDYSFGDIQTFNSGSHEIMISFQTTSKKPTLDQLDEELNNSIFDDNKSGKKKRKEKD